MLERIKKEIFDSEPFQELSSVVKAANPARPLQLRGVGGSLLAFVAAKVCEEQQQQLIIVVPEKDQAEKLRDDCALLVGEEKVHLYIHSASHLGRLLDMTASIEQIESLRALANGERCIVVASAEGFVSHIPPKEILGQRFFLFETGRDYPFDQFLRRLSELGFERKEFVEEYGDYAVRGGIVDVYPFVGENPIRIEFWGDSIESIREFDALSQRSIQQLQSATVVASLAMEKTHEGQLACVLDYIDPNAAIILDEPVFIRKEIEELQRLGIGAAFQWEEIDQRVSKFRRFVHASIEVNPQPDINFSSISQPTLNGNIKLLVQQLTEFVDKGYHIYLACDTKEEANRLQELIEEELTAPSIANFQLPIDDLTTQSAIDNRKSEINYQLTTEALHSGFIFPPARLVLFTEHEIFGRLKRRGLSKRRRFRGFTQKELFQLKRGDYVVHVDYGIGRSAGLEKIKLQDVEQEVLKILYADNDTLYVNLNYVNRVQKYSSKEGHVPTLTKLGTEQWDKLKLRAKKKIKDIARELITLYARRKLEQGFPFSPDTHWQKELEASFMYEDTPDQASATLDVKKDLENPSPMDRLICGDVGFGKTEVAVRASFKSVMDGKQVAMLVPTTILAQQHLNTFIDRLGRYSVRVESLTRFKSKTQQNEILDALKQGKVDILIGTHRLLSKDVSFKDLGLLIIDEEHRFGVAAKEKLRQLRASVDTLTLTATPIPRTLHFSLMGARDLSIINTPPRNRLPIVTEILQFDFKLIREAILREMRRGGQVYFVHDRVQTIEEIQALLEEHVPEARFHVAHGQMKGHKLEKTMFDFLEKKYDVLICTKIIESGIDIATVNTIIINRADRFGMAELYQLRGRVGRSNVQAYAYLLTPPLTVLPKATLRRLQAIQEFTELGSGFNLAMRDLEIRGAGNLLGAEQSGFIIEMGFEMYQRVVDEAVTELQQQEFANVFKEKTESRFYREETSVNVDVDAFIPDFYVESDAERLDLYRRLYKAERLEDVQSIREELRDRFGEYPEEVEHLLAIVELKVIAAQLGFRKVELHEDRLALVFPPSDKKEFYEQANGEVVPFQVIMDRVSHLKHHQPHLKQDGEQLKLLVRIDGDSLPISRLLAAREFLENLQKLKIPLFSNEF